ncbi:Vacuolar protein sorting-associated protein VTA1-like protein [Frankliniella fusca]|uniref:Vacuolar protein sorting-associated protein VTA1-like protein n=1 Tax=Frankliniella fusca TaxID=407009 RepID=A0AAE1HM29_9NEOP|nr:Vacuolar protein sorting-associated protein VTA1-like protein [Frankliniella fusca]
MTDIPTCPPTLKAIQHYLKIAQEHASRDPVVAYWSQLHALQTALSIDKNSPESKIFLVKMMDRLEAMKKELKENEAITNEVAAQAHIENYALKLFVWADSQDRASNFGKNVVKAFYTSGMLFDVLTTFGELSEEIQQNRKYAKWKAAYIHNCLKNGETPVPGPMKIEGEDEEEEGNDTIGGSGISSGNENPSNELPTVPSPSSPGSRNATDDFGLPQVPPSLPVIPPNDFNPPAPTQPVLPSPDFGFNLPSTPVPQPSLPSTQILDPSSRPSLPPGDSSWKPSGSGGVHLTPEQMTKAQKYCKFAGSALSYDDVPTALLNLEKAVHLLKTGVDPQ